MKLFAEFFKFEKREDDGEAEGDTDDWLGVFGGICIGDEVEVIIVDSSSSCMLSYLFVKEKFWKKKTQK